jgi:2-oxoglutarate ferredoxin oxidoreductase subunit delta
MSDSSDEVEKPSLQPETTESDDGDKPKGSSQLPLTIFYHWCKGCNICIAFCPQKVFEPDRDGKPIIARPEACTQCAFCWMHCPDLAIISNEK